MADQIRFCPEFVVLDVLCTTAQSPIGGLEVDAYENSAKTDGRIDRRTQLLG